MPLVQLLWIEGGLSGLSFLGARAHLQEQIVKIFGPGLMVLFEEKDQFAQPVAFAKGVEAILKTQGAGKEVMHQPAGELGDDADGFEGLSATEKLDAEKRPHGRAEDVQPMFDLVDRQGGFIGVEDGFLGQDLPPAGFQMAPGPGVVLAERSEGWLR